MDYEKMSNKDLLDFLALNTFLLNQCGRANQFGIYPENCWQYEAVVDACIAEWRKRTSGLSDFEYLAINIDEE